MRAGICKRLDWLGVMLEQSSNLDHAQRISPAKSQVQVFVTPTDEEIVPPMRWRSLSPEWNYPGQLGRGTDTSGPGFSRKLVSPKVGTCAEQARMQVYASVKTIKCPPRSRGPLSYISFWVRGTQRKHRPTCTTLRIMRTGTSPRDRDDAYRHEADIWRMVADQVANCIAN